MIMKVINQITQWNEDWKLFRAIGCILFNSIQFKGEIEKEKLNWLMNENEWKKFDIESLTHSQFSQLFSFIRKNEF